eukprot:5850264-Prymnesium_polylepis.1
MSVHHRQGAEHSSHGTCEAQDWCPRPKLRPEPSWCTLAAVHWPHAGGGDRSQERPKRGSDRYRVVAHSCACGACGLRLTRERSCAI